MRMRGGTGLACWLFLLTLLPGPGRQCSGAEDRLDLRYSFDEGVPPDLEIDTEVARVTDRQGEVISGDGSLLCDTRTTFEQWHEFLTSTPAVKFELGRRYSVSFIYRVLENPNGSFFCLLRPRDEEDRVSAHRLFAPWWTGETGDEGRRDAEFIVTDQQDYMLVLGVLDRAALVIDKLEIKEITAADHRRFVPALRKGSPLVSSSRKRIEELDDARELDYVLEESVIVVDPSEATRKREDGIVVGRLVPDAIIGTSETLYSSGLGVRTIAIAPPYTELGPEWPDPIVWDKRVELFTDRGFILPLAREGMRVAMEPREGYRMCINGPSWGRLQRNAALTKLRWHEGIVQPGLGGVIAQDATECFCGACNEGFQAWLREIYSPRELRDWGIRNVDEFSVRTYRLRSRLEGDRMLSDLVLREWIRWKYFSHLARWAEYVEQMKEEGDREGRGVPVGASPGEAGAGNPYTVAAGTLHDFWVMGGSAGGKGILPILAEIPLWTGTCVNGSPVWLTSTPLEDLGEGFDVSMGYPDAVGLFAGGLALGAVPAVPMIESTTPVNDFIRPPFRDDLVREMRRRLRDLIARYRSLYCYRKSFHNIAVVYSVPSLMWSVPGEGESAHLSAFRRTCRTLLENNIPYDVLVFDHPLMFPEGERLRLAGKYNVILLPSVDCVSPAQMTMLETFAKKGGWVYAEGPCAVFDHDYNPRRRPGIEGVDLSDLGKSEEVVKDLREIAWLRLPRIGPGVVGSAWRSQGGKMYAVHLARIPSTGDADSPPSSLRVAVKTPSSFEPERAIFVTPENLDGLEVEVSREPTGALVIEVPLPSTYAVLVLYREEYLERLNGQLRERREQDRRRVMRVNRNRRGGISTEAVPGDRVLSGE